MQNSKTNETKPCLINETKAKKCSVTKKTTSSTNEYEITTYPIFDNDNYVTMVIVYGIDITKDKKLERLLFLTNEVAHEIHNPLQIIKWKIDNIKNNLRNWRDKEYFINKIDQILNETERTVSIIKRLSLFSFKQNIEKKLTVLNTVISDSLEYVKNLNQTNKIVTNLRYPSNKSIKLVLMQIA